MINLLCGNRNWITERTNLFVAKYIASMLLFLAISSIVLTVLFYGHYHLTRHSRKGKLIDKIPGPYAWPLIGNVGLFMIPFEKIWFLSRNLNKEYYPIYRIWNPLFPVVNIQHPDDVGALLSSPKHIEKSFFYNFIRPWLGTGLLTSTGEKWFERRKILTPAFHFNVLQQFVSIFIEQSEQLVQSLRLQGGEVTCDLVPLLHKYTINSICETAMGTTSKMEEKCMNQYRSCVSEMGDIALSRLVKPWLYKDWMFTFSKIYKKQVDVLQILHGFSRKIIEERKQSQEEIRPDDGSDETFGFENVYFKGKRRLAMLDLLISASKTNANLDDEGIREEVDTFIFEGHDTTAMGLCFALLLLAENKEIQEKARTEVDALFERKNSAELSVRDVQSLAYLERCIKESLRLFPSVHFISRNVNEDLRLSGYLIPAGTIINVHIWDLHRDANFWPNPNVYDPDRFLPELSQGRHPFAYVPFSAGQRNCIGQKFAMLELKVLIANVLNNFYLEPIDRSSEIQIYPDLILRPKSSVRIKFIRR